MNSRNLLADVDYAPNPVKASGRRYFGELHADTTGFLLGGVKRTCSVAFSTVDEASAWLSQAMLANLQAGRSCKGNVRVIPAQARKAKARRRAHR